MTDVFLSYSRKDTESVKELFESLGARNREVWIDLHGIEYSSKWWDEICAGIDGADNFVLMVSQNSLESLFCHREIQYALKHNKRIIPFLLRPVDEKAMYKVWQNDPELCKYDQQTKENWESIQSIQWIDFTKIKDIEKGVDALLETVDTDPERVKLHTRLLLRMRDWEITGQNPSGLLRGDELALYEKWFADSREKGTPPHPTDEQESYITESRRNQNELEAKRIQRERLVKGFRVASLALGGFLILTMLAIFFLNTKVTQTTAQVAFGNTQIAISEKTLTPIPPTLTAVAQTVVAGRYMIESLNLSGEANSILNTGVGDAETAALLSIRVLRKMYLPSADAALINASSRLKAIPYTIPTQGIRSRVAFSPDGKTFLVGITQDNSATVELRDTVSEEVLWSMNPNVDWIYSVAFSPDGKMIVVAGSNKTAVILDTASGKLIHVLVGHGDLVESAIFSPDSKTVLTEGNGTDITVRLWDVKTGKQIYSIPVFPGSPGLIFFSSGKLFYATGSVYNASDGSLNNDWHIGGGTLAISPDEKTYLSRLDPNVVLRKMNNSQDLMSFIGHTDSIVSASFSGDGSLLVTGSADNSARVWDVATGKQLLLLSGSPSHVESVAFSPDGTKVLTGSSIVRLWTINTDNQQFSFSPSSGITTAAISPDGLTILVGDDSGNTGLWNLANGDFIRGFPKDNHDVKSVAFSPDGRHVAISANQTTTSVDINIYELSKGTPEKIITMQTLHPFVDNFVFSADGKTLLATDDGGFSSLYEVESGQLLRQFRGYTKKGVISPDGQLANLDGGSRWLNLSSGSELDFPVEMAGKSIYGSKLAFNTNGKMIAISSGDNSISVWDFTTKKLIIRLSGHTDQINSLVFSPDDKFLLSGSADKTARLWDLSNGQLIRVYTGHTAAVTTVAFLQDGKKIVTTSLDGTVRTWITNYQEFLTYVCTLIGNDLTAEERILYGVSDQDPTCPKFGAQPQDVEQTPTPILTLTPLPVWTPIATPTQGNP